MCGIAPGEKKHSQCSTSWWWILAVIAMSLSVCPLTYLKNTNCFVLVAPGEKKQAHTGASWWWIVVILILLIILVTLVVVFCIVRFCCCRGDIYQRMNPAFFSTIDMLTGVS